METFLTRFRDGVRGSSAFPEGFVRKFRLTDCAFTLTVFDGDVQDASAYKRACLSALEAKEKLDLAFVFTSAAQEHLTGNESPYLVSKSTFMSQSIAVQEFQVENITDSPSIAYPLSTMALAVYAKLGGTPFAIKDPKWWRVDAEREVQAILWVMLRAVFDDVVDEENLPKLGHSAYRADFALPSLGLFIEVKLFVGEIGEGQWAVRYAGTGDQIVAARAQRGPQRVADDSQVGDLGLDLSEFGLGAGLQPVLGAVPVAAHVE